MAAGFLLIAALLLVCAVAGALLLGLGLRGRRISANPHCRKCRFDLVGLAIDAPDSRCPECGASLREPRAVRAGLRKRRPIVAAVGAAVLLVPIAIVGITLAASVRNNVHALKPDFWLMIEARSASPAAITPQLGELLARMQVGTLGSSNTTALIERALDVQADHAGGWDTAWGDILDFAAAGGLLSEEQLARNARNAPVWTMQVRPKVVEGDDWVVALALGPSRVGNAPAGRMPLVFQPQLREIRSGDRVLYANRGIGASRMGIHSGGGSAMTQRLQVPEGESGVYEVTALWELGVAVDYDRDPIVTWTEEREAKIEILPQGTTSIELVDDPGMRERVLQSLSLTQGLRVSPQALSGVPQVGYGIQCRNPPMDLAFDLIARERLAADAPAGTVPREWHVGSVAFSGGGSHNHGGGLEARGFDAAAVDLVLRPSVHAAQGTLGIYKIWDGEVVFRNVPVNDPNAKQLQDVPPRDRAAMSPLPEASSP
jgi:hypothetical protein